MSLMTDHKTRVVSAIASILRVLCLTLLN